MHGPAWRVTTVPRSVLDPLQCVQGRESKASLPHSPKHPLENLLTTHQSFALSGGNGFGARMCDLSCGLVRGSDVSRKSELGQVLSLITDPLGQLACVYARVCACVRACVHMRPCVHGQVCLCACVRVCVCGRKTHNVFVSCVYVCVCSCVCECV